MDSLKALRQPLAILVIVAVGAIGVLQLIAMLVASGREGGFLGAAQIRAESLMPWYSAVLVLLVVMSCTLVLPRTPSARKVALTGLIVVGVLGALSALLGMAGLASMNQRGGLTLVLGFLMHLAGLAIVVGCVIALHRIWQHTPDTSEEYHSLPPAGSTLSPQSLVPGAGQPVATQPQPGQPGWQGDPQQGAMWGSAQQAASGASASGWAGAQQGWTPASLPPHTSTPGSLPPQPGVPQQPGPQVAQPPQHPTLGSGYGTSRSHQPPANPSQPNQPGAAGPYEHSAPPSSQSSADAEDYTRIAQPRQWPPSSGSYGG
ncbi:hypothetical protein ACQBAU_14110 [Propionibacteriaceae bacterium Y2011]